MKTKNCFIAFAALVSLLVSLSVNAQTPSPTGSPTGSPAAAAKQTSRPIPFHGTISAVDQTNKTFTISGKTTTRVFKVTDKTTVTKGADAATMTDIAENQKVSGSYWKNPDGTLEAKTVKLGGAEKKSASPTPKASPSPKA